MTQQAKRMVGPVAVTVILALALVLAIASPAVGSNGVEKSVQWICLVPQPPPAPPETVTFVSAPERARDGINQANTKAGVVFNEQFGEVCHVE
jgi:hypothetical protein